MKFTDIKKLERIMKLRKEGKTYKSIGNYVGVTSQRIGQILNPKPKKVYTRNRKPVLNQVPKAPVVKVKMYKDYVEAEKKRLGYTPIDIS